MAIPSTYSLQIDQDILSNPRFTHQCTPVFMWGRGDLGQLGLGDNAGRECPTFVSPLFDKSIVHIAASDFHTAFLTEEGELFMTGNNDYGQLGVGSRGLKLSPVRVSALDTHRISHLACGQAHTVAVTDLGSLVSWGASEFGQLGLMDNFEDVIQPRIVKGTRDLRFVQVACGAAHTLALTGSGDVYSFGQGIYGALGHGNMEICSSPTFVKELWGLGVVQVACGENHSAALSFDGEVFTWGRGKYGQLGHHILENELKPTKVNGLGDIIQVVCGGNHTMAVDRKGVLFSWGQGHWGQTGLGVVEDTLFPKQICHLQGLWIVQASAGARHSIAATDEGKLYGWGDGEEGQLGYIDNKIQLLPVLMFTHGPEVPQLLYALAAGGHTVSVFRHPHLDNTRSLGSWSVDIQQQSSMAHVYEELFCNENGASSQTFSTEEHRAFCEMMKLLDRFKLVDGPLTKFVHGGGIKPIKVPYVPKFLEECDSSARSLVRFTLAIEDIFSSVKFLTSSFMWLTTVTLKTEKQGEVKDCNELGLDILLIRDFYQRILDLHNLEIKRKLIASLMRLLEGMEKYMLDFPESRWTRVLLIILQCPLIGDNGPSDSLSTVFFRIFGHISSNVKDILSMWVLTYPKDIFREHFIHGVQRYITGRKDFFSSHTSDCRIEMPKDLAAAIMVLQFLFEANKLARVPVVSCEEFYNSAVSDIDMPKFWEEQFMKWTYVQKNVSEKLICFLQVPFLLTKRVKSRIVQMEADILKEASYENSIAQGLATTCSTNPFLVLTVRRHDIIVDTLWQLSELDPSEFKKKLKVIFYGEDGVDEGGVTKEFFKILVSKLFDVGYGMFTYNEETQYYWFNANASDFDEFWLVGVILGLSIYNGAVLDLHLPKVVYKKIMGLPVYLEDLNDFLPEIARGLKHLLESIDDVFDTFSLYFQVTYDYFGEFRTHDLVPNGGDVPVTNENRERYVDLYVKYLLEDSIEEQFSAFSEAFKMTCGSSISIFHYEELELLISGLPQYDFNELEEVTTYEGYSRNSNVIVWFWELVREMSIEEKKSLLFFTTGADRVPIGGLGTLSFEIMRNGGDTYRLPTAHTCFNSLLLPEYSTKLKLENKLKISLANPSGFGLK